MTFAESGFLSGLSFELFLEVLLGASFFFFVAVAKIIILYAGK